jgi:hypothetical protein
MGNLSVAIIGTEVESSEKLNTVTAPIEDGTHDRHRASK